MRARVLAIAFAMACATPAEPFKGISADGFGGVRVGMTVEQASAAYGAPLEPVARIDDDARSCYYTFPRGVVGPVSFMIVDERVARIDVAGPGPVTASGAGVGSSESEVLRAYGDRVKTSPHKYAGPGAHYLTVESVESAIIFETDGTRVTSIRAGKLPEVSWVERCS